MRELILIAVACFLTVWDVTSNNMIILKTVAQFGAIVSRVFIG